MSEIDVTFLHGYPDIGLIEIEVNFSTDDYSDRADPCSE
jgi:hypothetical protein